MHFGSNFDLINEINLPWNKYAGFNCCGPFVSVIPDQLLLNNPIEANRSMDCVGIVGGVVLKRPLGSRPVAEKKRKKIVIA